MVFIGDDDDLGAMLGGAPSFQALISHLPGAIAAFPCTETGGTAIVNILGLAARNGVYSGGVVLNSVPFPAGGKAAYIQAAGTPKMELYTASLANAWNFKTGWMGVWFKNDAYAANQYILYPDSPQPYSASIRTHNPDSSLPLNFNTAQPYKTVQYWTRSVDWTFTFMSWQENVAMKAYMQGTLVGTTTFPGPLGTTLQYNHLYAGYHPFVGGIAWPIFGAGSVPTDSQIDALWKAAYNGTYHGLMVTGDSWCTDNDYWIDTLVASLQIEEGAGWREHPLRIGYSGQKTAYWHSHLDSTLPSLTCTDPRYILTHIGTNDFDALGNPTNEAAFKADFGGGIDAQRARFPASDLYFDFPYRDDLADGRYDAGCLLLKQYMIDVMSSFPVKVHAGTDCNVWFKNNIVAYSPDRLHPNTDAGRAAYAAEWMTVLGY